MTTRPRPLIDAASIQRRVAGLAREITARYAGEPFLAVCVLKGAFIFFADLVRQFPESPEVDFVRLASYGAGTSPGASIRFTKDLEADIAGRHVLLVEDIVDTGHSLRFLVDELTRRGPLSVRICALVDKHERREAALDVDFVGFRVESGFIVGYGMDFAEQHRCLNEICELSPEDVQGKT